MKLKLIFLLILLMAIGCQQGTESHSPNEKQAMLDLCREYYDEINRDIFDKKLPKVAIFLVEDTSKLPTLRQSSKHKVCGVYMGEFNIIHIVIDKMHSEEQIRQTIYHEACHVAQYHLVYPEIVRQHKSKVFAQSELLEKEYFDPLTKEWFTKSQVSDGHGHVFQALMDKVNAFYDDEPVSIHCGELCK